MEYLIETEDIGGFVIASSKWFNNFSEELSYSLDIVLDINGKTDLAADYLKQDWKKVWSHHANYFVTMCNCGEVAMLLLQEGVYTLIFHKDYIDYSNSVHFANLKIDNDVYLAEIGGFLEDYLSQEKYEEFQKIECLSGLYELYYVQSKEDEEVIINLFSKKVQSFDNSKISHLIYV